MMEDVIQIFKISATTLHTTSTRPMPQYSPFPLGISTTAFHVASSARCPYPKATLTGATTFSQCVISSVSVSLLPSVYSPPGPLIDAATPSADFSFAVASSYFLASTSHILRCSAHIPEGTLERFF